METISVSNEVRGILSLTFRGEVKDMSDVGQLKVDIEKVSKAIKNLHDAQNKGVRVLIDIVGFSADYVSEGIDALITLARSDKDLVEKTAVFGGSTKIQVIGETIVALAGRRNIKFFETKAEAIIWLES